MTTRAQLVQGIMMFSALLQRAFARTTDEAETLNYAVARGVNQLRKASPPLGWGIEVRFLLFKARKGETKAQYLSTTRYKTDAFNLLKQQTPYNLSKVQQTLMQVERNPRMFALRLSDDELHQLLTKAPTDVLTEYAQQTYNRSQATQKALKPINLTDVAAGKPICQFYIPGEVEVSLQGKSLSQLKKMSRPSIPYTGTLDTVNAKSENDLDSRGTDQKDELVEL